VLQDQHAHSIQEQLCYFKNIRASTKRQRRQLEESIREKMLILHADWSSFSRDQYPELFNDVRHDNGESRQKLPLKKVVTSQTHEFLSSSRIDAQDDQSFSVERLLQNSRRFAEQTLRGPLLQKHSDSCLAQELQSKVNRDFLERMERIFDDFADWKV